MLQENNRALKEWAVICSALASGEQIGLLRKGGICEEEGEFRVQDKEFFLFPTYEHQKLELLRDDWKDNLKNNSAAQDKLALSEYAVVDCVLKVQNEQQIISCKDEFIWNDDYMKIRFDFNPYDPLYLILLRVYQLEQPLHLPMKPEYGGCKSWVTLEANIALHDIREVLSEEEYQHKKRRILACL
jgi:hypothetical protein